MDRVLKSLVYTGAVISFGFVLLIIGYVGFKGIGHIDLGLFSLHYTTENLSLLPSLITTFIIGAISLLIAIPIGVFSAIYMVEYADNQSFIIRVIRLATETLAGIPSIVYGLFGLLFFVTYLNWGFSLIAGSVTLAIMVLPLIIRTTEEALLSVDNSLREASYALGVSKVRTIFKIVLPTALPGIFSGIVLAFGRIMGESAALIYTAGTVPNLPKGIFSSGRTLTIHMYSLITEGINRDKAYATAVVLLIFVLVVNFMSNKISQRLMKERVNDKN